MSDKATISQISGGASPGDDSQLGKAPWEYVPLGTFAKAKGGFGFPLNRQGKRQGQYPFFKVSDMNLPLNGKWMIEANNWVDEEDLVALKAKTFPRGAVVFPKIGATILTNKKRLLSRPSVIDNNVVAIVIEDTTQCDPEFLYQWFQTIDLGKLANQGTVPSITASRLYEAHIPLPSLSEQLKIAGVLGLVQRAIEQQERVLALTDELKESLLHQLFTNGLRNEPQKQTDLGPIPHGWDVKPLGDFLAEAQYGLSVKGRRSGNYPLLRMTNQRDGRVVEDNLQYADVSDEEFERFRVARQDVLFNRTNSLELVGRTAIFELSGDFVFASYLIRLRTDPERLRPHFLNYYLNADKTQVRLKSIATRAVSQSNISATRLRGFPIVVPSASEQDEIVDTIESVHRKLALQRRKRAGLSDLFRTLLHELMSARIRVNDVDLSMLNSQE